MINLLLRMTNNQQTYFNMLPRINMLCRAFVIKDIGYILAPHQILLDEYNLSGQAAQLFFYVK